jgi:hypothetical protein
VSVRWPLNPNPRHNAGPKRAGLEWFEPADSVLKLVSLLSSAGNDGPHGGGMLRSTRKPRFALGLADELRLT